MLVVALVGGFLFFASGRFGGTEVSVAVADRGTAVDAVPGVVQVRAERTVDLRTESEGRVVETELELGREVKAGEVLLRLDDAELVHAIERVRLDLQAEKAVQEIGSLLRYDLEEAREDLARKEDLYENGQFSRRELDAQKRQVARLEDQIALEEVREKHRLQALENELERLEDELGKMTVLAPVSGTVAEVLAFPDDVVGARSAVARLLSDQRIVEASLSEEDFSGVKAGQSATVRFLSYGSRLFSAEVAKVLPAADPETQRYTVHLEVEMPPELMVPGITGEVSIVLDERDDALLVPRRALVGRNVFVVRDGLADLRQVKTGFISLNTVEVLEGLDEGDQVAVENLDRLRQGDRVRLSHGR